IHVSVSVHTSVCRDNLQKHGVCIRVLGDLDMLPLDIQKLIAQAVLSTRTHNNDISEFLLEKCLYTSNSPDPELLIRTSGEVRLSDFLLWQTSYSCLVFQSVLWPEYSFWNLCEAILQYQLNHYTLQRAREVHREEQVLEQLEADRSCVADLLQQDGTGNLLDSQSKKDLLQKYTAEREKRIHCFLNILQEKRNNFFVELNKNSLASAKA
uniref:ditrans,polycis-polyprenyl diphosphate synthase [(2E,6E)-farnesyldiphosphate specific] n=1 Tax=Erpetoichthys calabaricus TaxID=27687 RepID=A0A8C4T1J6_ERPCA